MHQQKSLKIAAGVISIAFIVYMWAKKDIVALYASLPQEEMVPLIATTVAVTLIKVLGIAGGLLLVKTIVNKLLKKRHSHKNNSNHG